MSICVQRSLVRVGTLGLVVRSSPAPRAPRPATGDTLGDSYPSLMPAEPDDDTLLADQSIIKRLTASAGRLDGYDTLTEGVVSRFHHELFHNHQEGINQHDGGRGMIIARVDSDEDIDPVGAHTLKVQPPAAAAAQNGLEGS